MSGAGENQYTVKWALFSFKGRIGRKTFALSGLLLHVVSLASLIHAVSNPTISIELSVVSASAVLGRIVLAASWITSYWIALALGVKRLHDLSLPPILAVTLIIPGISYIAWICLAVIPSKQETNEHGPVPFPKK